MWKVHLQETVHEGGVVIQGREGAGQEAVQLFEDGDALLLSEAGAVEQLTDAVPALRDHPPMLHVQVPGLPAHKPRHMLLAMHRHIHLAPDCHESLQRMNEGHLLCSAYVEVPAMEGLGYTPNRETCSVFHRTQAGASSEHN